MGKLKYCDYCDYVGKKIEDENNFVRVWLFDEKYEADFEGGRVEWDVCKPCAYSWLSKSKHIPMKKLKWFTPTK